MPRNFRLRQIGWIFFYLVASCSEKTSLQIFQPAEIDTSDIQRIAIGVSRLESSRKHCRGKSGRLDQKSVNLTDEKSDFVKKYSGSVSQSINQGPFFEVLLTDEFSSLENDAALQQMIATQSYITRCGCSAE